MTEPGAFTGYREEWDIEFPLLPPTPPRRGCDHPRVIHGMRRPFLEVIAYVSSCPDCGAEAAKTIQA